MKFKNWFLVTAVLIIAAVLFSWACQEAVYTNEGINKAEICTPSVVITTPFTYDGAGEFCWETTSLGSYINSWSLDILEVNGTSYLNIYVAGFSIPMVNNKYVIHYKSSVSWGHFEILGSSPTITPTALQTATRSATQSATTISRTATATTTVITRTATATRTATTRTATPSRTSTATRTATSAVTSTATRTATSAVTSTATRTATAAIGTTAPPGTPYTGNATWFTGIGGTSYGGCGMAQAYLDTQNFIALNVQNTPYEYSIFYSRPIAPEYASKIGLFNNGLNCGRWVRVVIGDYCNGINDGAQYLPFCRDGTGWAPDVYNGAELYMIVADSCQDDNAWCRDDPYHIDLTRDSLNTFIKDGVPVGDMDPDHWNNRQVHWEFVKAPGYTGDVRIAFIKDAQLYWPAIAVSHLENGIHGVDYFDGTSWVKAKMNADMGQTYVIGSTTLVNGVPGTDYRIRVYDAADQLINGGRVYNFALPASCGANCPLMFNEVIYTIE